MQCLTLTLNKIKTKIIREKNVMHHEIERNEKKSEIFFIRNVIEHQRLILQFQSKFGSIIGC